MRGRTIWREPPKSSICTFCAARIGTVRLPSHVQRRFIQSSNPTSKPLQNASVAREDDVSNTSSNNPMQNGVRTAQTGAPVARWGRPAFGNGNATSGGDAKSNNSFGRPAFGSNKIELTPEEARTRDALAQAAVNNGQRSVQINAGPGPQTTRAGRPDPMTQAEKISLEASSARRKALEAEESRRQREGRPLRPLIRYASGQAPVERLSGAQYSRDTEQRSNARYEAGSTWTHLRRRNDDLTTAAQPEDNFDTEQRIREERSKLRQYTRLSTDRLSTPRDYGFTGTSGGERSILEPGHGDAARTNGGERPSSRPWNPSDFARSSNRVTPSFGGTDRSQGQGSQMQVEESAAMDQLSREFGNRKAEKFASQAPKQTRWMNQPPKGKDRDKARRREQFSTDELDEEQEEAALRAELKRQKKREKAAKKAAAPIPIFLPEYITIANLASALKIRFEELMSKMEELGFEEVTSDHILNSENAGLIAMEYNFEPIIDRSASEDLKARPLPEDSSIYPQRPPVVTIMGHVDHGKTTLLDYLRKSSVAATEHGGITQHIGAFSVPMPSGKLITFLDTPGHAAFLNMRQRGANVTDIVILVVAADDSVKPQTIEAIRHAQAAKVPIIVAINKIDKEDANVERVKQDLARHGVDVEDFGGDTQVVCVSGKTGQGLDELEETVVALSEIIDMRAETDGPAEGWVLEASLKSMGKVATVLVRRGTMRPGDFIVAGSTWARIRCLRNEAGVEVAEAGPGTPVEIDGWRVQPLAGDEVLQAPTEDKAKSVVDYRLEMNERERMAKDMEAINESRRIEQDKRAEEKRAADAQDADVDAVTATEPKPEEQSGPKQVYFIVKGDVSGSVEAVVDSIAALGNQEVQPHILRSGVGQLTEFDIEHAAVAKGHLINFNTSVDPNIAGLAEKAKITILDHNIIYRLVDDVKAKLSEHLPPLLTQRVLGEAEVAQIFEITVKGRQHKAIAGCKVRNGTVSRNAKVRVLRNGEKIFDGSLASLKNVKKDVPEMKKGSECGLGFDGWNDFQVGDQIQSYEVKEEKRYL